MFKPEFMREILRQIQEADPDYRVFGATQHRYQLGAVLMEEEIRAFERLRGVMIPEDYREFLREVGNGGVTSESLLFMGNSGAGPGYGILSLEESAQGGDLRQPFPFVEKTESLSEEEVDHLRDPDLFPACPGSLALCHMGSGWVLSLVVNGATYGTMWEGRENYFPLGLSFGEWYGQWLNKQVEKAIPILANEKVIAGKIKIGMTKSEVIEICGGCGEWTQREWLPPKFNLSFASLATHFELDEEERIVRLIEHSIY